MQDWRRVMCPGCRVHCRIVALSIVIAPLQGALECITRMQGVALRYFILPFQGKDDFGCLKGRLESGHFVSGSAGSLKG